MTNPEPNAAQPSNNPQNSRFVREIDDFREAMGRLNDLTEMHMFFLLSSVERIAKQINSGGSSADASAKAAGDADFVDQSKKNGGDISPDSRETSKDISASANENELHRRIEQALILAVDNCVANQQQLNLIGQQIVTLAASRLLGNPPAE